MVPSMDRLSLGENRTPQRPRLLTAGHTSSPPPPPHPAPAPRRPQTLPNPQTGATTLTSSSLALALVVGACFSRCARPNCLQPHAALPPQHPLPPPCSAGLCCAALLARYGYRVTVCEAHYHAGGAAHGFEVDGYEFDAGPSFFAGLSGPQGVPTTNPLKQVLDAVGESVECVTYDRVSQHE